MFRIELSALLTPQRGDPHRVIIIEMIWEVDESSKFFFWSRLGVCSFCFLGKSEVFAIQLEPMDTFFILW